MLKEKKKTSLLPLRRLTNNSHSHPVRRAVHHSQLPPWEKDLQTPRGWRLLRPYLQAHNDVCVRAAVLKLLSLRTTFDF